MILKLLPFAFFALLAALPATQGCKSQEGRVPDPDTTPAQIAKRFQAKLDSSLSDSERTVLAQDGLALAQYQIDGSGNRWFAKLFGGNSSADVLKFLDERIKHIFPIRTEITLLPLENTPSPVSKQGATSPTNPTQATIYATNYGPMLWFEQLRRSETQLYFETNQKLVVPSDSRVGVIKISPAYIDSANPNHDKARSSVFRTSILVHEARHSDCQGGLRKDDVDSIRDIGMPLNQSCAHLHGRCPTTLDHPQIPASLGHPMAGELMCDQSPWGAYSVQMVYALALSKNCANCTEIEKQEALMIVSDSFMRISQFAMPMLKGERGEPNMTSQGLHP